VRRPAQQLLAYGGAGLAGGIAVASAVEAWARLQHPAGVPGGYGGLAAELALIVVLPLIAIGAGLALNWLVRRLAGGRAALEAGGPAVALRLPDAPSAAPADPGALNDRPVQPQDRAGQHGRPTAL
jgi:hypothetical protein